MANTERLKVLALVREARDTVGEARLRPGLSSQNLSELNTLYLELDKLEGVLILKDIAARVDALQSDANDLEKIAGDLRASIQALKDVADKVDKAAKAIKILVDIASKAAAL